MKGNVMNAVEKVKHLILLKAQEFYPESKMGEITSDTLDAEYEAMEEREEHYDAESETRCGDFETEIPCESSRHYESKSVAARYIDGSWVGWTYWYGGGKHGEPEAVEWIGNAYDVECVEEERTVTVREFSVAV